MGSQRLDKIRTSRLGKEKPVSLRLRTPLSQERRTSPYSTRYESPCYFVFTNYFRSCSHVRSDSYVTPDVHMTFSVVFLVYDYLSISHWPKYVNDSNLMLTFTSSLCVLPVLGAEEGGRNWSECVLGSICSAGEFWALKEETKSRSISCRPHFTLKIHIK